MTSCVGRRSPALGGEVVAVDRTFFHSVGGYDPGMLLWGEEQVELSIRVRAAHRPTGIHLLVMLRGGNDLWKRGTSCCTFQLWNVDLS